MRSTGAPQRGRRCGPRPRGGDAGVWPSNSLPAGDRPLAELLPSADHVEGAAGGAVVDRQRQPPVALLADHPVVHVQEPVELALVAEAGDPPDPVHDLHDLVAEARVDLLGVSSRAAGRRRAHADEPLVDQPEEERRPAAPAVRVAVPVRLQAVEDSRAARGAPRSGSATSAHSRPVRHPNPSRKRPASSRGAMTGRPSALPRW